MKTEIRLYCLATFFFVLLWTNPVAVSAGSSGSAKQLFSEAQALFTKGLNLQGERKRLVMLKVAGQFQTLIGEFGIENGHLYYNIGNAYYEAGEKGKAILNYRKAERLIPGFVDLRYNLDQVRRELNLPADKANWWTDIVKGFFFWHFMADYSTRRSIFLGVFVLFWALSIGLIFQRHILVKVGLVVVLLLNLGFGGSYLLSSYELYFVRSGVVIEKRTVARKGPGRSYEPFFEQAIPGGTEFRIVEEQGEWWKVELTNGENIWLNKDDIGSL